MQPAVGELLEHFVYLWAFGVVAHFDGRTMKHPLTRHNRTYQDVTGQD